MGFDLRCEWLWIDTACIDKTDSSELSEALNSMFGWYRSATLCYAYLHDVGPGDMFDFAKSDWFTRGWTLQELLAPGVVVFLAKDWSVLGHKCPYNTTMCRVTCKGLGRNLVQMLARITQLKPEILKDYNKAKTVSLQEKLSWAMRRVTRRVEDKAYCMLGICGVFMPPVYGEGPTAWSRLVAAATSKTILDPKLQAEIKSEFSSVWISSEETTMHDYPGRLAFTQLNLARSNWLWKATADAVTGRLVRTQISLVPDLPNEPVKLQPSALGPVIERQQLRRLIPTVLKKSTRLVHHTQCGLCFGNRYGNSVTICKSIYCHNPKSHENCATAPAGCAADGKLCRTCASVVPEVPPKLELSGEETFIRDFLAFGTGYPPQRRLGGPYQFSI